MGLDSLLRGEGKTMLRHIQVLTWQKVEGMSGEGSRGLG